MTLKKQQDDNLLLTGKKIYLIGGQRFVCDLIAFYLKNESGAECAYMEDSANIPFEKNDVPALLLMECPDDDCDVFLYSLEKGDKRLTNDFFIALFNVNQGQGIEEKAVACGVKGIFYRQDPLSQFQKGISAIFNSELWVSREVLTKYVMDNRGRSKSSDKDQVVLTSREIEILALISTGTKNEDIADKLYISPNTVKTHIYNIFKKIDVPNRLQAALWAAKNL